MTAGTDVGARRPTSPGRATVLALAVSTGAIAANLYYVQPLLQVIGDGLGVSPSTVGLAVTVTQVTFAAGLILLLPLGDMIDRRRLLTALLALEIAGLLVVATAPALPVLLGGFAVVGLASVAAQVVVPAAAAMAADADRGTVVGTVVSGLLVGILVARTVAGLVDGWVGWRPLFFAAAVLMLGVLFLLRRVVPATSRGERLSYPAVLRSTLRLFASERRLRRRAAFGMAGFATFSLFWTTLTYLLSGPPYGYSSTTIGLFGLLGAAGALAANLTGRLRRHTHPLPTIIAIGTIAAAFALLLGAPVSLALLAVGIVVLDVGVQGLHVLNQRTIFDIDPAARNRANSGYMTCYFLGGAVGSAVGSAAWEHGGWTAVCVAGLAIAAAAAIYWLTTLRSAAPRPDPTA